MHKTSLRGDHFVIQMPSEDQHFPAPKPTFSSPASSSSSPSQYRHKLLNFSAMKIFNRFRKILMRMIFNVPSSRGSSAASRQRNCESRYSYEPPKTSCSSYYSSQTHYSEAIADCIEFFNKSSQQEGILLDGRKSDALV